MKKMKRIRALLMITIMAVSMLAGCGAKENAEDDTKTTVEENVENEDNNETEEDANVSTEDETAETGYVVEVLRQQADMDWGGPNPYLHSTRGPGTQKMTFVFDSLMTAGPEGLIPWLAESCEIGDEGMSYTYKIHEDALWHDGTPVTTDDIAFTIDYYREFMPMQDVSYTLGSGENFVIDTYEIIDEYTIKIFAAKKLASNERNIGSFPIIPKHIWENVEDPYTYNESDAFIGCGMYKLNAYDSATGTYEFEAFDQYYGHQQAAHYIQFVPVSDNILAFENNEIDITEVPADLIAKYSEDSNVALMEKMDDFGYKMLINFDNVPELKDLEVRKALYKALDREAMVEAFFRGQGTVASAGHIPQSSIYYTDEVEKYDYAPEEAKAVLEPLGLTLKLTVEEDTVKLAELVKLNLEDAGVAVEIEVYDTATRDAKASSGDYEILINSHGGWNMTPDYMRTMYSDKSKNLTPSPLNLSSYGYTNDKITELAEAQVFETDFHKRIELFQELQVEVSKEIPVLPLITQVSTMAYRPDVYDCWRKEFDFQQFQLGRISYVVSLED